MFSIFTHVMSSDTHHEPGLLMIKHNFTILSLCQRMNTKETKNKVLHTTQDINVSIESTLLENNPASLLQLHSLE